MRKIFYPEEDKWIYNQSIKHGNKWKQIYE